MLNEAPANRLLVYLSRQTECRENLFVWLHEKDENMSKHYFAGACIRSLYATQLPAVAIIIYSYLFICSVPLMLLDEFVAGAAKLLLRNVCVQLYIEIVSSRRDLIGYELNQSWSKNKLHFLYQWTSPKHSVYVRSGRLCKSLSLHDIDSSALQRATKQMMIKYCQGRICNALEPRWEQQMKSVAPTLRELLGRWIMLLRRNQNHSFPTGALAVTHRAVNPF